MNSDTSLKGLGTNMICAECQQAALDKFKRADIDGYAEAFQFCSHTSRALIISGMDGKAASFEVSVPSDQETLEQTWQTRSNKKDILFDMARAEIQRQNGGLN